jgi:uncharacterized membrane protein (UPF0127 family)
VGTPSISRYGFKALILAELSLVILLGWQWTRGAPVFEFCDLHFSGGLTLTGVPVARTAAQRAKGLMFRGNVETGMLFSWQTSHERTFWMRNTHFPLSIGFFSDDGTLFAIKDMRADSDEPHFSGDRAKDALELAQGAFSRLGLAVGSRLLGRECKVRESSRRRD